MRSTCDRLLSAPQGGQTTGDRLGRSATNTEWVGGIEVSLEAVGRTILRSTDPDNNNNILIPKYMCIYIHTDVNEFIISS